MDGSARGSKSATLDAGETSAASPSPPACAPPDAVYYAAKSLRRRIRLALLASRLDAKVKRS